VVALVGILAVLSMYSVRRYINNSKTAEAYNSLGRIGKDAAMAFDKGSNTGNVMHQGTSSASEDHLCASATATVPDSISKVKGQKYQSSQADWEADKSSNAGFTCLKFSMQLPQYFVYSYQSDATSFTSTANADLNGDGLISSFQIVGSVRNDTVFVAPSITVIAAP